MIFENYDKDLELLKEQPNPGSNIEAKSIIHLSFLTEKQGTG